MTTSKCTFIVGAGLAGLTAAHHLAQAGRKCVLVEKDTQVGGLCRSFTLDKTVFDLGPHVFFIEKGTDVGAYMEEMLSRGPCISRPFSMAIQAEGRYWRFPNHIDFFFYPWKYKKHILASLFKRRTKAPTEDLSAEQELSIKCGEKFYHDIFSKMLKKKTLVPGNCLHFHWLARVDRTVDNQKEPFRPMPRVKTLLSFLKRLRQPYVYPIGGCGKLPMTIWDEYTRIGGETLLNSEITETVIQDNRLDSVSINNQWYQVEDVIWTPSINTLNTLINPSCNKLRYLDLILIYLTYNTANRKKRPFVYTYHLDNDLLFNRIYYPSSIFKGKNPMDREGLCLECAATDKLTQKTDRELINDAIEGIERLGIYEKEQLRKTHVVRLKEIMPVYEMDYEQQMERAYRQVQNLSNVYSVGRQGGFLFCLSPGAVGQGIKIGKALSNA